MRRSIAIVLLSLLVPAAGSTQWRHVEKLAGEQKLAEALEESDRILATASREKNPRLTTEALIKGTQLRIGLHGYETAVRFLSGRKWPADAPSKILLHVFSAHALERYARNYSFEIRSREKTVSSKDADLRAWSLDRIAAEIRGHHAKALALTGRSAAAPPKFFASAISLNSYPAGVRGTTRDLVVGLAVAHLADTAFWSAAESNAVGLLDLGALAALRKIPAAVSLPADEPHPLVKIASLLRDHARFHSKRPAAALEARYELVRRLAERAGAADLDAIRDALALFQKTAPRVPWWAMGQELLADLHERGEAPDRRIRSLAEARKGLEAFPKSDGAKFLRRRVASLLEPQLSLDAMRTDAAGRKSVAVTASNVGRIHFRAYPLDVGARLKSKKRASFRLWPADDELGAMLKDAKGAVRWTVDVPASKDHLPHRTLVAPPLKAPGGYLIVASLKESFATEDNVVVSVPLIVSDLAARAEGAEDGGYDVRVVRGANGEPVAGARVTAWKEDRAGAATRGDWKTAADGRVRITGADGSSAMILVEKDGNLALITGLWFGGRGESRGQESRAAFVYTDRAIYRPGQKILWKIVAYRGNTADRSKYEVLPGTTVDVVLRDVNGEEVGKSSVRTNEHGSASGEFTAAAGRALGGWSIQVAGASSLYGFAPVAVEEYKRPTFEASIKDPAKAPRLNAPVSLTGEARFYFGQPVSSGQVRWRVTRVPEWPWWIDGGFRRPGARARRTIMTETVATGRSATSADGTFKIEFTAKADPREAKGADAPTYRFRVEADVTDEGGETRTASRDFRLGFAALAARFEADSNFFVPGEPVKLRAILTDLDGNPRAGRAKWRIAPVEQPAKPVLPADLPREAAASGFAVGDDGRRARWETDWDWEKTSALWPEARTAAASGESRHDAKGEARIELAKGLPGGLYRLTLEARDEFGKMLTVSKPFLVVSEKTEFAFPLLFLARKTAYRPGETARVFLASSVPGLVAEWTVARSGEVRKRESRPARAAFLEIPVTDTDRGGFTLTVTSVADHQLLAATRDVEVPWENKELKVEFATFRDRLAPGAKETFRVTVASVDPRAPVAGAELLASMYDRSLDFFRRPHFPEPRALYPSGNGAVPATWSFGWSGSSTFASTVEKSFDVPSWSEDSLRFEDDYGIGGPGRRGGIGGFEGFGGPRGGLAMARGATAPMAAAPQVLKADGLTAQASLAENAPGRGPEPAANASPPAADPARANFSETAFWRPHLVTGADGSASFEFQVPESLTAWTLWARAVTKDLRSGGVEKEVKTAKDLMVRPALPRFLRENDEAELRVTINNASARDLSGELEIDVLDPESETGALAKWGLREPVKRAFSAKAGGATTIAFKVKAPRELGTYSFVARAKAGEFSDGERRALPVLPSRLHLAQSRFAVLKDRDRAMLEFKDLAASGDGTRVNEKLVVTVDGQLFYSLLDAVPYLIEYPYECAEQTMNRFLSTGILSSMFAKYPAVAVMAKELAKRDTPLEDFAGPDPNRRMALEESPWLAEARGGDRPDGLKKVLDPGIAKAERERALTRLRKMQLANGAFPWFDGGRESEYMTLYLLMGFARANEFGVDAPKDVVVKAWRFVKDWADRETPRMLKEHCCFELVTMLNYVLHSYPGDEWTGGAFTAADRKRFLEFSFRHWKKHSPLLKGYLALTLARENRAADAKLVWGSVMDSAKLDPGTGTDWAQEARTWLWYNDTVESHAFALRVQTELGPNEPKTAGLVQWLFLNKKLGHWKSTKATAEAIYAVAHYLDKTARPVARERVDVKAGAVKATFTFEPDRYTGKKNRLVIDGPDVGAAVSKIEVVKEAPGLAFASATWHYATDRLPKAGSGDFFRVSRKYFLRAHDGKAWRLRPLADGAKVGVGDQVEVRISIAAKHPAEYVHLRDPRPAGFEPENLNSGWTGDGMLWWYAETRDSGANYFFERLPKGEYEFKTRLRATVAGKFRAAPATLQSLYAPEFNAFSTGEEMVIFGGK